MDVPGRSVKDLMGLNTGFAKRADFALTRRKTFQSFRVVGTNHEINELRFFFAPVAGLRLPIP